VGLTLSQRIFRLLAETLGCLGSGKPSSLVVIFTFKNNRLTSNMNELLGNFGTCGLAG